MAILGSIIKNVIHLGETVQGNKNPKEEQEKVLSELLSKAKNTAFGKFYGFDKILNSENIQEEFAKKVPYFDYNKIDKQWWSRIKNEESDICWPGLPHYFALSSGTTGKKSKRIPVTEDMIAAIRNAGIKQVLAMDNFDLSEDFFEKEIMMLGSSTDLKENKHFLEGEISGISASNIPFWFKGYYKPGEDIARIEDWDQRVKSIAKNARNWDIGALSGIPSWMELMLKEVIAYNKVKNIHEIWPNLEVFTSGGVAFQPYEKSFNALLGKPITVIDTYLASEGFIACQTRPQTEAMELITDNGIYFEFVPFKAEYIQEDGSLTFDAPAVTIDKVVRHQDYILLMSTVSGTWRYLIGDTIEFINIERAEIKITGRTKFFLNTVGSQLSVNKMNDALLHLEQKFEIKIPEFTLCAKRFEDGEFYHSWYLGSETKIEAEKLAEELDTFLKDANKNYRVARSKALKGVKVNVVSPERFHDWSGKNKKKGGQVKMARVMKEDKFKEWEAFIAEG